MNFISAAHTDVGIKKKVNQDAFCLKIASTKIGRVAFAVLCDGMGGLNMGELASAFLVNAFSMWFEQVFPAELNSGVDAQRLFGEWNELVQKQNVLIRDFGSGQGFSLGTTLTAILICGDDYAAVHVGDSRLYSLTTSMQQLTRDHSLVAFEVEQGRLTPEQAETDSRRNILLQCVGASSTVTPQFLTGKVRPNEVFLLCSDGFRHVVSAPEVYGVLAPDLLTNDQIVKRSLADLIELNKSRGETDNITAVALKCTA